MGKGVQLVGMKQGDLEGCRGMVVRSPCQENYPAHAPPACTSRCWGRQTQHGLGVCIWMHLVNGTGNSPSPGQPTLE